MMMYMMLLWRKWVEEEILNELRRKNNELEGEKRKLQSRLRVWGKKYKNLEQRVLQLGKDALMPKK